MMLPLAPGIRVSPIAGLVTSEDGATAQFSVVLDTQPGADVAIPISTGNPNEGSVSASALVFTPSNWNLPQTVTVTGVNDVVVDGSVAVCG